MSFRTNGVCLALAWNPRGEHERFRRLQPVFSQWYSRIVISAPPDADPAALEVIASLPDMTIEARGDWASGRHVALEMALQSGVDFVHYVDGDRLIRWCELHPDELRRTVDAVQMVDYLVIGRTPAAFATHPHALQQTEAITNAVFSHLVGQPLDLCAGSKGLSRAAVAFLLRNGDPLGGLGVDAEWVVLLHRGGFSISGVLVDGLDWETADRYLPNAADAERRRRRNAAPRCRRRSKALGISRSRAARDGTSGTCRADPPADGGVMNPLRYLLYPPVGDIQEAYPLILFLHAIGERGDDLDLVKKWGLPKVSETGEVALPAYIAAPQCPAAARWSDVLDALDALLDDLLAHYPIDPNRVLLTGFSMGSFGTWSWALQRPERFAALMPVGGNGYWREFALQEIDFTPLQTMPLWMVHGAQDAAVPVSGADEFAAALVALGANFGYTRYPDADHGGTSDRAFCDMTMLRWLLAQKRSE